MWWPGAWHCRRMVYLVLGLPHQDDPVISTVRAWRSNRENSFSSEVVWWAHSGQCALARELTSAEGGCDGQLSPDRATQSDSISLLESFCASYIFVGRISDLLRERENMWRTLSERKLSLNRRWKQ